MKEHRQSELAACAKFVTASNIVGAASSYCQYQGPHRLRSSALTLHQRSLSGNLPDPIHSLGIGQQSSVCLTFPPDRVLQVDLYKVHLHSDPLFIRLVVKAASSRYGPHPLQSVRSLFYIFRAFFTCKGEAFPSTPYGLLRFSLVISHLSFRSKAAKLSWQGK